MTIQGTRERILDSVLPHEVTRLIFATHFGRPLPRWVEEGAGTTVEHESQRAKQQQLLMTFLLTGRGIAFNRMFAMMEYPNDVLPLYAQGYSLARYLMERRGPQEFVQYVGDGLEWNNWAKATREHCGFHSLSELQLAWLDWVRRGSPHVVPCQDTPAINDLPQQGVLPKDPQSQDFELTTNAKRLAADDASNISAGAKRATGASPPPGRYGPQREPIAPVLRLGRDFSVDKNGIIWHCGRAIGYWGVNGHESGPSPTTPCR
jgi:hypothetical protein